MQKTLGVTAENFNAEGLNKLTQAQLTALLISARPDPRKGASDVSGERDDASRKGQGAGDGGRR